MYPIRILSAQSLLKLGDASEALPFLVNLMNDRSGNVREVAAYSLGHSEQSTAVDPLLMAMDDPANTMTFKETLINSMSYIKDQRVDAKLQSLLTDPTWETNPALFMALSRECGQEALPLLSNQRERISDPKAISYLDLVIKGLGGK